MRVRPGDTLIEVLFAFVILATIVGFAFTGALQAWRAAVDAQDRTQATLVAQYYADGLKTYRDSIGWSQEKDGLFSPTFLDGGGFSPAVPPLVGMESFINTPSQFCMKLAPSLEGIQKWDIDQTVANCAAFIKSNLAQSLQNPAVNITLKAATMPNPNQVIATITVSWQARNRTATESVVNTIILAAER